MKPGASSLSHRADVAGLGTWLRSWIQANGAIYGFHNHSVWGGNPYRFADFTSGHSTWASPFLAGLAASLSKNRDARGLSLLERLIGFQTDSFQKNGEYRYIGFQVGELLNRGLIHNAIANVSLGQCALVGKKFLSSETSDRIRKSILRNMEACRVYENGRAGNGSVCNQEYARIWGKILFDRAFEERRWYDEVPEDLDFMIRHFHVSGIPDGESAGTLRSLSDQGALEPAEYYGLMICPLVAAFEIYGEQRFLEAAGKLCRHVARSSWVDPDGRTRLHRFWYRRSVTWLKNNTPMLIAGMGDSLDGILNYLRHEKDAELSDFLKRMDQTYAAFQHPGGFFLSATGWDSEVDVAPSTAWHAHDFRYLSHRHEPAPDFWDRFFSESARTSVLLGRQCLWVERGPHWMIDDYFWQDVFKLRGRKDEARFGRDLGWIGGAKALPEKFLFPKPPVFLKDEAGVYLKSGKEDELDIMSACGLAYLGLF